MRKLKVAGVVIPTILASIYILGRSEKTTKPEGLKATNNIERRADETPSIKKTEATGTTKTETTGTTIVGDTMNLPPDEAAAVIIGAGIDIDGGSSGEPIPAEEAAKNVYGDYETEKTDIK